MKILFYIEPWIEKSNPAYRKPSFLIDQHKAIRALQSFTDDLDIHMIVSDAVIYSTPMFESQKMPNVTYHVITQNELEQIYPNYKVAANKTYNSTWTLEEIEQYKQLFSSKLKGFKPDVIVSFESVVNHLREVFPNTLILNQYFGFLSRKPLPRLPCYDAFGVYKDGLMAKFKDELNTIKASDQDRLLLSQMRDVYFANKTADELKVAHTLYKPRRKFEKIVLFPLQGSNYFAFEENHPAISQFEYICDTLDRLDPKVGLLVTEHTDRERILNDSNLPYLRAKYPNFIHFEELNEIRNHSQLAIKQCDGVAFVTSSLGYMGAFLQKPVFQIGNYESFASSGNRVEDISSILSRKHKIDKDPAFVYLLNNFYVTGDFTNDGAKLHDFLQRSIEKYRAGVTGLEFYDNNNILEFFANKHKPTITKTAKPKLKTPAAVVKKQVVKKIAGDDLLRQVVSGPEQLISFDVFDTVLLRPFNQPKMLFQLINDAACDILEMPPLPFAKFRATIESELRKTKLKNFNYHVEVTLDEIYAEMGERFGFSDKALKKVKELEIKTEIDLCYRRDYMFNIYQAALDAGKKVIFISDTYLDYKTMEALLHKNGYTTYEKLIVSSEYGCRKHDGLLYAKLIADKVIEPANTLHIGDNSTGDIESSAKYKIKNYLVPKPIDLLFKSDEAHGLLFKTALSDCPYNSVVVGVLANKLFDNYYEKQILKPFNHGTLFDGSPYNLGLCALGPLVFNYVSWMIKEAIKAKIKKLYFLAREGKIFMDVYEILKPFYPGAPESEYLLCSRRCVLGSNFKGINDILNVVYASRKNSITNIFENKLGVSGDLIDEQIVRDAGFTDKNQILDFQYDFKKFAQVLKGHERIIFDNVEEEKRNYLEYLDSIGLYDGKKDNSAIGVVDIGYSGTMQSKLSELLNRKIHGFYMGTQAGAMKLTERGLSYSSYLFENNNPIDKVYWHPLTPYLSLLENLLSSSDGGLVKFVKTESGVEPLYWYTSTEEKRVEFLKKEQAGILDFCHEITKLFKEQTPEIVNPPSFALNILMHYFQKPTAKDARMLSGMSMENNIKHAKDLFIVPHLSQLSSIKLKRLLKEHIWAEGTTVLFNMNLKINPKVSPQLKEKQMLSRYESVKNGKLTRMARKMNKLVNNPEQFWKDSGIILKPLKYVIHNDKRRRITRKLMRDPGMFTRDMMSKLFSQ